MAEVGVGVGQVTKGSELCSRVLGLAEVGSSQEGKGESGMKAGGSTLTGGSAHAGFQGFHDEIY